MDSNFTLHSLIETSDLVHCKELGSSLFSLEATSGNWHDISSSENEQLITTIKSGTPWQEALFNFLATKNNSWLEKMTLSPSRHLFLDLLPLNQNMRVLDLGSGWGQLTRALSTRAGEIVSLESNLDRLRINHAIAAQEKLQNILFLHANGTRLPFKSETFDCIILCGVFEWLAEEGTGEVETVQRDVLATLFSFLKPAGQLIIAIENRVGLKYLFGERDDHSRISGVSCLQFEEAKSAYFEATQQELRARTYSRNEYRALLNDAGFSNTQFYLAYPDYKLPQLLIPESDIDTLCQITETIQFPEEHDGCDGTPSRFGGLLDIAYRSLGSSSALAELAPSFIIQSSRD